MLIEHLKEHMKWNFKEKINYKQSFRDFSKTWAHKLETIGAIFASCNPFPSGPSAAQNIYFYC